jgi:hypothetical protein
MPQFSRFPHRASHRAYRSSQPILNTRQLDLVLLAGCSCLLTMLCQPLATALTPQANSTSAWINYPSRIQNVTYLVMYHNNQMKQPLKKSA